MAGQLGWFVCVLSAAHDVAWVGIGCVVILLVLHLRYAAQPVRELRLAALIVLCAAPWETALIRTGLVVYSHGVLWPGVVPPWLLGLWGLFAIQLNVLFRWLRSRPWLAVALGAMAGPLSFRAGVALGAASFPDTAMALLALAAGWALWMPLLVWLAQRHDGIRTRG